MWATLTLHEYIIKGFVHDDERLKLKILKSDIATAKNYLIEREIADLDRIVEQYLLYAESQAARQIPMRMADWIVRLNAFLKFNEYDILTNAGSVSHEIARDLAEKHYEAFRVNQDRTSRVTSKRKLSGSRTRTSRECVQVPINNPT
jgi:hypothetical protein